MKIQECHFPGELPEWPVREQPLVNEAGIQYGWEYEPALMGEDCVLLVPPPEKCDCDGCRGVGDVWEQTRFTYQVRVETAIDSNGWTKGWNVWSCDLTTGDLSLHRETRDNEYLEPILHMRRVEQRVGVQTEFAILPDWMDLEECTPEERNAAARYSDSLGGPEQIFLFCEKHDLTMPTLELIALWWGYSK